MRNLETVVDALRAFVIQNHWHITKETEVPSGKQFQVSDGSLRVPVTCYTNGNILVQGNANELRTQLQTWAITWRQQQGFLKGSQPTNQQAEGNLWTEKEET